MTDKNDHDGKDQRPTIAQDDRKKPDTEAKEKWNNPTDTMDEAPAGSPNADKQSRTS
ncbi:hypothetical protein [Loktanella sp. SALINAS62]|uniref:hypothetical protein n=1 Tax=Loktanella sp. SALINAS62 TaxID=2706124 RepID=UPI001B8AD7DD|nr:hypothetical protein [Loktanella sp. SALINAS62]MBS1301937.1 hypothetical protein [Loktanella sp. SALINAS62]